MQHGGYMVRFVALVIDGFILMVVDSILAGVFMVGAGSGAFTLIADVAAWLYFILFEMKAHATPGKMIMGLKVVGADGPDINFVQANIRFWAKIIFLVVLLGRLIICKLTGNKQAAIEIREERPFLHDQWAKTLVLKK